MSDDGAHRLLLAEYPHGGRDAGGTADKGRGCVAVSTQNLDLTQYRPEAGALGDLTLALIIAVCVAINLSCRAMGRPAPEFLRVNIHKIAFVFGFIIVLCAKLMFVV